jgi:hypothetical protein
MQIFGTAASSTKNTYGLSNTTTRRGWSCAPFAPIEPIVDQYEIAGDHSDVDEVSRTHRDLLIDLCRVRNAIMLFLQAEVSMALHWHHTVTT